ncbi:aspartoacylase [Pleionea sp. CnH1-48]|uniref:aspartoacylase n=1 Tax=Pleionea sp. CnH1-48 TaxID=2954494 RepID=UPI002096FBFF|nr:aspartoacylase [Pleionea sp. CnH1-48]MCO7224092.1 aspartoacylase [Pleionea sp. CnH1-48]
MISKIKKVLIVGGTHGNEVTGVFLLNKWQQRPELIQRESFEVDWLLGNPEAVAANRRYVDKDLNRCFSSEALAMASDNNQELQRAHQLVEQLGGKGHCQYDLIIDLHTSTANMKTNLVLTKHDAFHTQMVAYAQQTLEDVVITSEAEFIPDHHFLCALADKNLVVEIGPVPQGVLKHETIEKTEQAVYCLLDFVEQYNQESLPQLPSRIEVLCYTGKVELPQDEQGNIIGFVHQNIDGQDYQIIQPGEPIFRTLNDEDIGYKGEEPAYISFVNEAAYYDKKLAFCLLQKKQVGVDKFEDG